MNRIAAAAYIAELATALAGIARAARLHDLAFLLSMAAEEAANQSMPESG